MKPAPFRVCLLDAAHERNRFASQSEPLNRYLREQATQDMRRRVAACFVALDGEARVVAYYTLASASILLTDLPAALARKLPRYPSVPAVRLGRLAVDHAFAGRGLGGALLADALHRAVHAEIAAYAMLVDAKDESAVAFYRHHGFVAFEQTPRTLFLPLVSVKP